MPTQGTIQYYTAVLELLQGELMSQPVNHPSDNAHNTELNITPWRVSSPFQRGGGGGEGRVGDTLTTASFLLSHLLVSGFWVSDS